MDLKFCYAFGRECKGKRNVAFYNDTTLIFIAGKLCILLDLETSTQKLIDITAGKKVSAITRCYNHLALAIEGSPPDICLFNLQSEAKKIFCGPRSMLSYQFMCISLSESHKFLAAYGGEPDWLVVLWLSQTREMIAIFQPTALKEDSFINDISFHAGGREEVVIAGRKLLRLYEYQEDENSEEIVFSEVVFEKYEEDLEYTSIAWPQKEYLAVSNTIGKIIFFRGIELVKEISVADSLIAFLDEETIKLLEISTSLKPITAFVTSPTELFCVFGGDIVVRYIGDEISKYKMHNLESFCSNKILSLLPGCVRRDSSTIIYLEMSPSNNMVVACTSTGEVAYLDCSIVDSSFTSVLPIQHTNPIRAMSVARGRPVVATCSENSTILWNYSSRIQEMRMKFKEEIFSLSIHPTGLYLALSFKFHIRVCTILCSGLKDRKMIQSKDCSGISFSNGGHFLAIANYATIKVYSFIDFSLLAKFTGHAGPITDLLWKENDTRFVSCDSHGVICEWDTVTWCKLWENTALLSYSKLTATPNDHFIIVVSKEKVLKCLFNSAVIWETNCTKYMTTIVSNFNGEALYAGIDDGCLGKLDIAELDNFSELYAHRGKIVDIMFNFDHTYLFSVCSHGLLFCWQFSGENEKMVECMFSNVGFISISESEDQKEKIKLLQMSIQENDMCYECDMKLNQLKHEEALNKLHVEHETVVQQFNHIISDLCEEKQVVLFESGGSDELKNLKDEYGQKIFEQSQILDAFYRTTDVYVSETSDKIKKYEDALENLEQTFVNTWTNDVNREETIISKIKKIERILVDEKKITEMEKLKFEKEKERLRNKVESEIARIKMAQKAKFEEEQIEAEKLKEKIRKLRNVISFTRKDAEKKYKITSGQIDFDIQEKLNCIQVFRDELKNRENKLKRKERIFQNIENKFFELRKSVGNLGSSQSVSRNAVEQVKSSIAVMEYEIESRKNEISEVTNSIPKLEEDIKVATEQCSTLAVKLRETVDGFHLKQELYRETQAIFSKYKSLLSGSLSPTCNAVELKDAILQVLDQYKNRSDDSLDPNLKAEFSHQIEKLQNVYLEIKEDPAKTTKDLSIAEFKLSQENSKLLDEVHEIQKEVEKWRDIIFEMEVAMGMPYSSKTKPTKKTDALRDKIELVVWWPMKDKAERADEMEKLDQLIEEQQSEIERLQKLISEKVKNKDAKKEQEID